MCLILIINFLLAVATTMVMTIIPFLVTDVLGLSLLTLGVIEGSTEFLSNLFRLVNGILYDQLKHKNKLFTLATSIALLSKLLLLVPNLISITIAKILERIANGAFAAPRDAYVAANAPNKGLALGLLACSKSAGCILGPILISLSTLFIGDLPTNLSLFISWSCILTIIAVIGSLFLTVNNIKPLAGSLLAIKPTFKQIKPILCLTWIFFSGRFNDGLLIIYLKQHHLPPWFYLSTISIFNLIMLGSPIIGKRIDQGYLKQMGYMSISALVVFNLAFYYLDHCTWGLAIIGLIAWGIQRTGSQIVFSAMIFHSITANYYGTAIGIYYIISGLATMLTSFLCGYLAKHHFSLVFCVSGSCAVLALIFYNYILLNNHKAIKDQY